MAASAKARAPRSCATSSPRGAESKNGKSD
jgi:hypothetical protein